MLNPMPESAHGSLGTTNLRQMSASLAIREPMQRKARDKRVPMSADSTRNHLTPQGGPSELVGSEFKETETTMAPECLLSGPVFLYHNGLGFGLNPKEVGQR